MLLKIITHIYNTIVALLNIKTKVEKLIDSSFTGRRPFLFAGERNKLPKLPVFYRNYLRARKP